MSWNCFRKTSGKELISEGFSLGDSEDQQSFFVITVVFNPASYESRYRLYRNFAQHMADTGAQLITIECIFPSLNQHEFKVTDASNPSHIQITSESVYWMKENLINIAVSKLPKHAKWVCWLDGDVTFHDPLWIQKTIRALNKYSVVQVFKKCKFLGPPPKNEVLRTDYSFGYSKVHEKIIDQTKYDLWYPHPGYGWAMSLHAFNYIGGLLDCDIVGSGDLHFAFSLINKVTNALESELNPRFKEMIVQSTNEIYKKLDDLSNAEGKSIVGYVPIVISHNWHGSRKDRQYVDRWKILIARNFNFEEDTIRLPNGLIQLSPNKPELQSDILICFQMRQEDNTVFDQKDNLVVNKTDKRQNKPVQNSILGTNKYKYRGGSGSSSSSSDDDAIRRNWQHTSNLTNYPNGTTPWDSNQECPLTTDGGPSCPNNPQDSCYANDYNGSHGQCTSSY